MENQLDERTKKELTEQIRKMAKVYTPEWKFDTDHPDVGAALALIFAELFAGTVNRYNLIPQKLERDFFAQMGIKRLPAVCAEGYAAFGLSSHEFGGAELKKGTVVSGPDTEGETVYKTAETLYVTPAELTQIIFTDGQQDYIEKKETDGPFFPFKAEKENLQEHAFYLCQDETLSVTGAAEFRLKLAPYDKKTAGEQLKWMEQAEEISISYACETGFEEFAFRSMDNGLLLLKKTDEQPNPKKRELFEKEGFWLCCRVKKPWKREPFLIRDVRISVKREGIEPDVIQNGEGEQKNDFVRPFGECPGLFSECYIASAETLQKAGAQIRMTFELDYEKIPFDRRVSAEPNWKPIMKRSDFRTDPEYEVTVEQVVWEYYNGSGFSRLFLPSEYETMFNGTKPGRSAEISFLCPKDAGLLEWQCAPTCYVRVRVVRMNHLYQAKGTYLTPVIRNIRFHYAYSEEGRPPEFAVAVNGMEHTVFPAAKLRTGSVRWEVFSGLTNRGRSLYLGFDRPLARGPVKLFCAVSAQAERTHHEVVFDYSQKEGFAPLTVCDGTDGFQKSGSLSIAGETDFAPLAVCGETAYWIRITEQTPRGNLRGEAAAVRGLYLNTVKIRAEDSGETARLGSAAASAHNQPPGAVNRLGSSHGYVNRVTNPMPVCGGTDPETVSEAVRRGKAAIRHRNRAVTAADYEALAREASRYVQKARCYPGYNLHGEYEPGSMTLIILQKEFEHGQIYFERIKERIVQYLYGKMDHAAVKRLYIAEPQFLRINCFADLVVSDPERLFETQELVKAELTKFIHPVTGNYHGHGFAIGSLPNEVQLTNAVKNLPGVRYVRELRVTTAHRTGGTGSILTDKGTGFSRYAVALSGTHTVRASAEQ